MVTILSIGLLRVACMVISFKNLLIQITTMEGPKLIDLFVLKSVFLRLLRTWHELCLTEI